MLLEKKPVQIVPQEEELRDLGVPIVSEEDWNVKIGAGRRMMATLVRHLQHERRVGGYQFTGNYPRGDITPTELCPEQTTNLAGDLGSLAGR